MDDDQAKSLAGRAQLYNLLNITFLPVVAFVLLVLLARAHWHSPSSLLRNHVRSALFASLWAGVLLGAVTLVILAMGGLTHPATWVVLLLYFISCHSALILLALFAMSRALAGREFAYPVIGARKW